MKQEAKLVYLLECLQKTAPPVLVFAEKTADVDDIHEYLLVKGVEAVAVHGGKDQEEREQAIDAFKARPRAPGKAAGLVVGGRQGSGTGSGQQGDREQGGRLWRMRGMRQAVDRTCAYWSRLWSWTAGLKHPHVHHGFDGSACALVTT